MSYETLPYHLESLEIEHCFGIQRAQLDSLPQDSQWVFFTGPESVTLLLKGIALAYYNQPLAGLPLPHALPGGKIKLGLVHEARTLPRIDYSFDGSKPFASHAYPRTEQSAYLLAYGSMRHPGNHGSWPPSPFKPAVAGVLSLLEDQPPARNLPLELVFNYFANLAIFETLERLLCQVWPSLQRVVIAQQAPEFVLQGGKAQTWSQLPTGVSSLLTWVADVYLRFSQQQGENLQPAELMGIVLIEEPELHLHPAFRRRLPQLLSQAFPRIQFIAATYSPLLMMGTPANATFVKLTGQGDNDFTLRRLELDLASLNPTSILASPLFEWEEPSLTDQPGPAQRDDYNLDAASHRTRA